MKTLSVGESRPKKSRLLAKLIMMVEGTDHSHSFISWKDEDLGIRKVAEARGAGARVVTNHTFKHENHVVRIYHYKIGPEKLKELEAWVWNHLAKPYGVKHLVGLLVMRLKNSFFRLIGSEKRAKNAQKDGDFSMICVELSAKAVELATGVDLPGEVEDYGLIEMHEINEEIGLPVLQEKIDRINGKS